MRRQFTTKSRFQNKEHKKKHKAETEKGIAERMNNKTNKTKKHV